MKKIDYKKELSSLYSLAKNKIVQVDVPSLNYLMVDGKGDPNTSKDFQLAIEALYSLSYTIKFRFKKGVEQIDYGVMPLEGLWWMDQMERFSTANKDEWKWTLMIMQPDFVTLKIVDEAKAVLAEKKKGGVMERVRLEAMKEGLCAQILHIGPFSEEWATIQKLHHYIQESGYTFTGKHREIYLSDMRRTAPEKLKTIIRQPIVKK